MTEPMLSFHRADRVGTIKAQEILTEKGYFARRANGEFGVMMQRSVVAFQKDHKLEPDGIVGDDTWAALTSTKKEKKVKKAKESAPAAAPAKKTEAKKAPAKKAAAKKK